MEYKEIWLVFVFMFFIGKQMFSQERALSFSFSKDYSYRFFDVKNEYDTSDFFNDYVTLQNDFEQATFANRFDLRYNNIFNDKLSLFLGIGFYNKGVEMKTHIRQFSSPRNGLISEIIFEGDLFITRFDRYISIPIGFKYRFIGNKKSNFNFSFSQNIQIYTNSKYLKYFELEGQDEKIDEKTSFSRINNYRPINLNSQLNFEYEYALYNSWLLSFVLSSSIDNFSNDINDSPYLSRWYSFGLGIGVQYSW